MMTNVRPLGRILVDRTELINTLVHINQIEIGNFVVSGSGANALMQVFKWTHRAALLRV